MTAYNPYYESPNRPLGKSSIRFSKTELQHLGVAVLALTVGLSFILAPGTGIMERLNAIAARPIILIASFLAVASGFVLHELAHKFVAIRYGCLAEFRASMGSLGISVLIAVLAKFLVAAPGAVQIYGRVDQKENGIISLVGPGTNMVLAALTLPLAVFLNGDAQFIAYTVSFVNALLAGFNLIPVGNFDGKKVMAWNKGVWGGALAVAILLFIGATIAPSLAI